MPHLHYLFYRGYLASCREIVTATRTIADAITDDIPELYVLGNPPASVVAFGSKHPNVDPLEVGDGMSRRGWHLNGLSQPKSVHIACTVGIYSPGFQLIILNPLMIFLKIIPYFFFLVISLMLWITPTLFALDCDIRT
jgi:hypothetical protein